MRFLSVCSGIEAASCAWHPLGWQAIAFSEIEPFPCAVLAHHYPNTPNWGDMTKYKDWPDADVDLLCGGTPCQSFSVAGLRKGLDDPRGNLMLTFGAIAGRYRPRWLVWENVPGVLSSSAGRDFGSFLGMLGQLGYGFAYRVLDAQYFGVAQRRRRVFVVGYLGDWRRAAAVLFERHSLSGNPAPSRQARQKPAPTLSGRTQGGGGLGTDFDCDGGLIVGTLTKNAICGGSAGGGDGRDSFMVPCAFGGNNTAGPIDVATSLNACASASGRMDFKSETFIAHSLRGEGFDASEDGTGRGTSIVPVHQAVSYAVRTANTGANGHGVSNDLSHTLDQAQGQAIVTTLAIRGRGNLPELETRTDGTANALLTPNGGRAGIGVGAIHYGMQVRRLTPEECEALQAFPRNYTRIPWRGKPADQCPDGPRYKALGNSWCVNNVRWLGARIQRADLLEIP